MYETLSEVAARLRIPQLADIAPNDPRFAQVEFMVEADDFAYQTLKSHWRATINWESDDSVTLVGLGILIGRNVNVNARFACLNGRRVMFYNSCSDLVDYNMVETFIGDVRKLGQTSRPESERAGNTDAIRFQDCIAFCQA